MKAVNLIPKDTRRRQVSVGTLDLKPASLLVAALAIVAILSAARVLVGNTVNDREATLAMASERVEATQAAITHLAQYTAALSAAQGRATAIRDLADSRFDWQRSFTQLSRVLPDGTWLKSLAATTSGAPSGGSTTSTSTSSAVSGTATGPTFTLAGCANTANQDGTATVMRRLQAITGVTSVSLTSSTRTKHCGSSFDVTVDFAAATTGTSGPARTAATEQTATTASAGAAG